MVGVVRATVGMVAVVALGACTVVGVPPAGPARPGGVADLPPAPSGAAPETGAVGPRPGGVSRSPRRFDDVRGLWVVRYSMTTPASVGAVVDRAAAAGFNTLLVQVRGRGDAVHPSGIEPRFGAMDGAPADFDPLARVVEEAHARGIAVHAWVNTNVVTEPTTLPDDPRHLVRAHPEALMVPRELARELLDLSPYDPRYVHRLLAWARAHDNRVEGLYAAPWSDDVRDRVEAVVLDLVERYDLDGVHLDYIRYPGPDFDYSAGSLGAFRAWAAARLTVGERRELDRAAEQNPLAWPDGRRDLWGDFRREQVTRLLERIHFTVKARRPWVAITAAVLPDTIEARRDRLQDWPGWIRDGLLDAVAPMAYSPSDARFRDQVSEVVAAAGGVEVWAGIGSYLTGLEGTLRKVAIARDLGAAGVVLFSYDWAVSPTGGGGAPFLESVGRELARCPPPRGARMVACAR